jgi:poly-gamma-glutamate capsule biosynthesis protein CapA/YwtB (metallophosphatase superfamily)
MVYDVNEYDIELFGNHPPMPEDIEMFNSSKSKYIIFGLGAIFTFVIGSKYFL